MNKFETSASFMGTCTRVSQGEPSHGENFCDSKLQGTPTFYRWVK